MTTEVLPEPAAMLREAGLRVTDTRQAVIIALGEHPHSGVDSIVAAVAAVLPSTSRQAVHNVLTDITTAGLARRIEPAGHPALYELRVGDNHHHIVCQRCGTIADVDCVTGHAPCLTPNTTHGFDLTEAEVTFWGVCADCQSDASPAPASSLLEEMKESSP
ncbi:Fur family transcriptional regulator [Demequina sediminicola]|uniref:Fur family transcriptional regulator n=1 Tax=Demequina sediminicola TaxID=1095026 RepID=UPI00078495A9|nr:Fur family transcriptional regulator [Demequina sediminicola]